MIPWTSIVPELPVKDLARALDHYREALGFSIDWEYDGRFASVSRDGLRIHLGVAEWDFTSGACSIYTDNVDAVYAELARRGAHLLSAPEDKPWGTREFALEDIDGHLFRFHTLLAARRHT